MAPFRRVRRRRGHSAPAPGPRGSRAARRPAPACATLGGFVTKWLVISEKPSVAQDIVRVLGGFREQDGYWESDDWVVTYAVGHLFELLEPEELDEKYKAWTLEVLPILPDDRGFQLKPKKGQSERIRTIKKLALRDDVEGFVNACDAGREGELIFREIVKYLGSEKPIRRLWLQSMTTDAIRTGFEQLLPGEQLDGLAASAEGSRTHSALRARAIIPLDTTQIAPSSAIVIASTEPEYGGDSTVHSRPSNRASHCPPRSSSR